MAPETEPTSFVRSMLRTPLLTKLLVLDLTMNLLTLVAVDRAPPELAFEVNLVALVVLMVLNVGLVAWALTPLRVLELTARQVTAGDFAARVRMGFGADRNLVRIGGAFNALLIRLNAERERVRKLATELVAAGDRERAQIARELHDGTAQSLSALDMLLASTLSDPAAAPLRDRLERMREITAITLSEVRTLSHNVHPRVLDDLGLASALEALVRRMQRPEVALHVDASTAITPPATVASVLYRVAQEALNNALRHGNPKNVWVTLVCADREARLEVRDDGAGFDPERPDRPVGMGLFVMQERAALVEGTLTITSQPGAGTTVTAKIPLEVR